MYDHSFVIHPRSNRYQIAGLRCFDCVANRRIIFWNSHSCCGPVPLGAGVARAYEVLGQVGVATALPPQPTGQQKKRKQAGKPRQEESAHRPAPKFMH